LLATAGRPIQSGLLLQDARSRGGAQEISGFWHILEKYCLW
jgi:hypothetical protein